MTDFHRIGARPQAPLAGPPFHRWLTPDSRPWTLFYRVGNDYLLRFPGLADFTVSHDGCSVIGWPVDGVSDATIEHLYRNQVLPLALAQRGCVVLHASAADIDGDGIAFVGGTGNGKSTLVAAFATRGFPSLGDDGVALTKDTTGYSIAPGHPSLRLWDDSLETLLGNEVLIAPQVHYTAKVRVQGGERIAFAQSACPLAALYLLDPKPSERIAIEPVDPAQAVVELLKNAFTLETERRSSLAAQFESLVDVVERTRCRRLRYPRRYDVLPQVIRTLLEQHVG